MYIERGAGAFVDYCTETLCIRYIVDIRYHISDAKVDRTLSNIGLSHL